MKTKVTYYPKPYESSPFGKVEITNFLMCNVSTLELVALLAKLGAPVGDDVLNWAGSRRESSPLPKRHYC